MEEGQPKTPQVSKPPTNPKIYHITHVDNLPSIIGGGYLWSDAALLQKAKGFLNIGMSRIKKRRLTEIEVYCHQGTFVGEYVPFYFCPRAVMLYLIYRGNSPDITYKGGQAPIVHLELDLYSVIKAADASNVPWAFSIGNAGAYYAEFYADLNELHRISWEAVRAQDWRDPKIKEGKQAEHLIFNRVPWHHVSKIGVLNDKIRQQVNTHLSYSTHRPLVSMMPSWYY